MNKKIFVIIILLLCLVGITGADIIKEIVKTENIYINENDELIREVGIGQFEVWVLKDKINTSDIQNIIDNNENYLLELDIKETNCNNIKIQKYKDNCLNDILLEQDFINGEIIMFQEKLEKVE